MAWYERDTRTAELRDPDFAKSVVDQVKNATPFTDQATKVRDVFNKMLKQPTSNWRAETLPSADDASVDEGADHVDYDGGDEPAKLTGWAQERASKGVRVSHRQQNVDQADVKSAMARMILRDTLAFMRGHERICLSTQAQSDGSWTNGRTKTGGAFWWLNPNPTSGTSVPPGTVRVDPNAFYTGTLAALTEDYFRYTMLGAAINQVKRELVLQGRVGIMLKKSMTDWKNRVAYTATINQPTRNVLLDGDNKLYNKVDFFEFDNVRLAVETDFNLACTLTDEERWVDSAYTANSGIFFEQGQFVMRFLNNIERFTPPDLGGGPRSFLYEDFMLQITSPQGCLACYINS